LKEGTPAEKKYYQNHKDGIGAWADAHKYFTRVMNGRKQLPIDDWKRELADKTAQQNRLFAESQKINAELKNAEAIKRLAERVSGVEPSQRKRTNEIGL
jgi:carbonic anhydrase